MVEHHDFGAEATADEGGDDAHLLFAEAEHGGDAVADGDGRLGGVPHGHLLAAGVPIGDDAAIFHGCGGASIIVQAAGDQHVGLVADRCVVAFLLDGVGV